MNSEKLNEAVHSIKMQNDEFLNKINEKDETIQKISEDLISRNLDYSSLLDLNKELVDNLYCLFA